MLRSLFRFLLMALALLIVALLSALAAMRYAIHGSEVTVPDMQGKTPAEAHRMAEESGLGLKVEREYYSSKVAEGRVLSQAPAPGTVVRRGWEVRLALSLGPQRVVIPAVIGESARAASIIIAQRGLDLGSMATIPLPGKTADQVVAQDPPAKATDVAAPKISLLVAEESPPPAFVMPSFVGLPLSSVRPMLQDAGFSLGVVTVAPAAMSAPQAGGPSPVEQPGAPAAAQDAPSPASTPAANTTTEASSPGPSPDSDVISQEPTPGQKILFGAVVNLVVR
ncbi:MAG: PASTA domain-containing protein [Acidobacteria bacterium]|nr:PASTA domain-containing protein [Acidobacteriota bacterium]